MNNTIPPLKGTISKQEAGASFSKSGKYIRRGKEKSRLVFTGLQGEEFAVAAVAIAKDDSIGFFRSFTHKKIQVLVDGKLKTVEVNIRSLARLHLSPKQISSDPEALTRAIQVHLNTQATQVDTLVKKYATALATLGEATAIKFPDRKLLRDSIPLALSEKSEGVLSIQVGKQTFITTWTDDGTKLDVHLHTRDPKAIVGRGSFKTVFATTPFFGEQQFVFLEPKERPEVTRDRPQLEEAYKKARERLQELQIQSPNATRKREINNLQQKIIDYKRILYPQIGSRQRLDVLHQRLGDSPLSKGFAPKPKTVRTLDGKAGGSIDIRMQGSLRSLLKSNAGKALSFSERIEICLQLAEAVKYAHENKILIGDLKTDNALIRVENGKLRACLGDLDGAATLDAQDRPLAPTSVSTKYPNILAVYSPSFQDEKEISTLENDPKMADEKIRDANERLDTVALGLMMLEIMTGSRHPFVNPESGWANLLSLPFAKSRIAWFFKNYRHIPQNKREELASALAGMVQKKPSDDAEFKVPQLEEICEVLRLLKDNPED